MKLKFVFFMCLFPVMLQAQRILTLEECIRMAQEHSPEAKHAHHNFLDAYYQYKLYKKSYLPTVSLSGSLPALNRSISKITMPDGTEAFVAQSYGNYSASLSLTQPIPFMGGQFFVSSGLQRLDIYQDSTTTSYLANMVNVGIRQSFSFYNEYKWQRQIEPMQYKEAKQAYIEALENAAVQVIELYFSLLEIQINLELNLQNKANSDTLLQIARERYQISKITEDEMLQVEVNNLNLILQIEDLQNTLQDKQVVLADYLGILSEPFILSLPSVVGLNTINRDEAYQQAIANGSMEVAHQRKLLEAKSEVARAKADNGFSVDLYASFGLSQSDPLLRNAYRTPLDQEQLTISFNVPITNWGITKYKRKRAEVRLLDLSLTIEQEKSDFCRLVNNTVNQYNIQATQFLVVQKTSELSQKRYEMTKERYANGKVNFLDYSVAQNEKDRSQIDYIQTLQKGWTKYYEIRKLTLFDFLTNKKIEAEPEVK